MPCCVPININRESFTGPYQIPSCCGCLYRVGDAEGLDVPGGVGRPEAEQRPAGELVVLEVGGGLDAGTAVVDSYGFYRIGSSGVGKGISAGKRECD